MKKLVLFSLGLMLVTLFVIIKLFQDTVVTFLEENAPPELARVVRKALFIPDEVGSEPVIVTFHNPDTVIVDDFPEFPIEDSVVTEEPEPAPVVIKEEKKPEVLVAEVIKVEPDKPKDEFANNEEDVFGNSSYTEEFFENDKPAPVKEDVAPKKENTPSTYVLSVTNGEQRAYHNGVISFRTQNDVEVDGMVIPRNSLFRALAKIENNKLYLFVDKVSINNVNHPVEMDGIDKDFVEGISFNESDIKTARKQQFVALPDNFKVNFRFSGVRK